MSKNMIPVTLNLNDLLAEILGEVRQPLDRVALDLVVLGLYRLGRISSCESASLLGMSRIDFINHSSDLGVPYLRYDSVDLDSEIQLGRTVLKGSHGGSIRGAQ